MFAHRLHTFRLNLSNSFDEPKYLRQSRGLDESQSFDQSHRERVGLTDDMPQPQYVRNCISIYVTHGKPQQFADPRRVYGDRN